MLELLFNPQKHGKHAGFNPPPNIWVVPVVGVCSHGKPMVSWSDLLPFPFTFYSVDFAA